MAHEEEEHSIKLLVPVADYVDRAKLAEALHALSVFKDPLIVLLHVVEVPFSAPLDPTLQKDEVYKAGLFVTPIAEWLREQKYHVKMEIRTARKSSEGIIEEAEEITVEEEAEEPEPAAPRAPVPAPKSKKKKAKKARPKRAKARKKAGAKKKKGARKKSSAKKGRRTKKR